MNIIKTNGRYPCIIITNSDQKSKERIIDVVKRFADENHWYSKENGYIGTVGRTENINLEISSDEIVITPSKHTLIPVIEAAIQN